MIRLENGCSGRRRAHQKAIKDAYSPQALRYPRRPTPPIVAMCVSFGRAYPSPSTWNSTTTSGSYGQTEAQKREEKLTIVCTPQDAVARRRSSHMSTGG